MVGKVKAFSVHVRYVSICLAFCFWGTTERQQSSTHSTGTIKKFSCFESLSMQQSVWGGPQTADGVVYFHPSRCAYQNSTQLPAFGFSEGSARA